MKHLIKMMFVLGLSSYYCHAVFAIQCTTTIINGNKCSCRNIPGKVDKFIGLCDVGWKTCYDESVSTPGAPCKCDLVQGKIKQKEAKCSYH